MKIPIVTTFDRIPPLRDMRKPFLGIGVALPHGFLLAGFLILSAGCTHSNRSGPVALPAAPAVTMSAPSLPSKDTSPAGSWVAFRQTIEPVLAQYCFRCHGPDRSEKDIRFDLFTDEPSLHARMDTFNRALVMLYGSKMPPPCEFQPSTAELNAIVAWIEARQRIEVAAQTGR